MSPPAGVMAVEVSGGILVGVGNHHDAAVPELEWGAREAAARALPLRLIRVYPAVASPFCGRTQESLPASPRRSDALRCMQTAISYLHLNWPGLTVVMNVVEGSPSVVLVEASATAAITVLGSRQLGAIEGAILGSVSSAVCAGAYAPVVVVGQRIRAPNQQPAVIVGIDGSAADPDVLAFAFDYADRHGRPLRAVLCREPDAAATPEKMLGSRPNDAAEHWLDEATRRWREKYPGVGVHLAVVPANPVAGLVAAAAGEDLLVLGGGGTPDHPARPRLGWVARGVLHYAECPVAIVHEKTLSTTRWGLQADGLSTAHAEAART